MNTDIKLRKIKNQFDNSIYEFIDIDENQIDKIYDIVFSDRYKISKINRSSITENYYYACSNITKSTAKECLELCIQNNLLAAYLPMGIHIKQFDNNKGLEYIKMAAMNGSIKAIKYMLSIIKGPERMEYIYMYLENNIADKKQFICNINLNDLRDEYHKIKLNMLNN